MLQILENCYQRNSVIATSQFPVSKWYDYINEPTLADAIMDRLTANAVRIVLKGDSMRRKNQKKNNNFVEPKATISEMAHLKTLQK